MPLRTARATAATMTAAATTAVTFIATVIAALTVAAPHAGAASAEPVIRYAGLAGNCLRSDGTRRPCGPWKLWLSDGRVVALPDARRIAKTETGYPAAAPLSISPHGARVAYFREDDGALMIWEAATGRARRVPGVGWPGDLRLVEITLSTRARFVGVYGLRGSRWVDRVVDTVTGRSFTLPEGRRSLRFSPDLKHMLADGQSVTEIYSTATWSVERRWVKQRRTDHLYGDLAPDGVTVATALRTETRGSAGNTVTLHNLATGERSTLSLRLRSGETVHRARWDGAGRLDVLTFSTRHVANRFRTTYTWYRLDRATHGLRRLDSFTATSALWNHRPAF
ncbi:hypothetical protein GCM10010156_26130 [Planobispora rosea]|uniref:Uncharacterized protein n=1 Tax=Planobispora rosea TaxID=35762 RepID=A0A8J3S186_PLARO|nr:hypothetical protein [Planobispora rosea]GGS65943.1 hypothetical protein GCM10010156_26130 [Planobispora rosea]GIH84974.1 hypothetical protein Pro02_33820 [Planobispora rosea]